MKFRKGQNRKRIRKSENISDRILRESIKMDLDKSMGYTIPESFYQENINREVNHAGL